MGFFFRSSEVNPINGVMEDVYLGYGADEGTVQFRRRQNIDEELKLAHESRAAAPCHFHNDEAMYKSASVPVVEVERWKSEMGFDWFKATPAERKDWMNKHGRPWKLRDVII